MAKIAPALAESPREAKVVARRDELADAALRTLGELGYARTSLREIAARSDLSHGVVHYYFADKLELIGYCVRRYKEHCATRYDEVVATATSADDLRDGFARALRRTLIDDAAMHRLWYDMRAQSMFEQALRDDVAAIDARLESMIWAVVARYAELRHAPLVPDAMLTYAALDGLFENCLVRHHAGDDAAGDRLAERAGALLDALVASSRA